MTDEAEVTRVELERMLAKWQHVQISPAAQSEAMASTKFLHDAFADLLEANARIGNIKRSTFAKEGEHSGSLAALLVHVSFAMGLEYGALPLWQATDDQFVALLYLRAGPYIHTAMAPCTKYWTQLIGGLMVNGAVPKSRALEMTRDFGLLMNNLCRRWFKVGLLTNHK